MRLPLTTAAALFCAALAPDTLAQGTQFSTPGMPRVNRGQTDQFSSELNPAFGVVFDGIVDWLELDDDDAGDEGLDATLRSLELTTNAWIDPDAWGYAVIVADEEEVELEEAAVHYVGFPGNSTLRAGRFFVDFGKQMQAHVHDLAYPERPAVLREYLGEELAGTGIELDHWLATGDESALRFSVGLFDSLLEAHAHGEEGEEEEGGEQLGPERPDLDEVNFTARVTGFADVGESGVFQWGLSLRNVPEFTFELDSSGFEEDGNSSNVFGLDLTYGITDDTGLKGWTFGGEALLFDGDIGAEVDDAGTPADDSDDTLVVLDGDVFGYYAWIDRQFGRTNSAGVLYSAFEHPEEEKPEDSELTLYYTRNLSEFGRLRFAVTQYDSDEGGDATRLLVQYTNFMGAHAHGVNW